MASAGSPESGGSRGRILIIVQNLPVPFDRRVWLEATSLTRAGYRVTVICPKLKGYNRSFEHIEGVDIHRYWMPFDPSSRAGFVAEHSWAFFRTFLKSFRVSLRGPGFDVIHACNPPETYFVLGVFWKLFGKRFVFDHHDLSPEMYQAKFGEAEGFLYRLLLRFERATFRAADVAIATNHSHRRLAIERGGMDPARVHVVRSGPDLARFTRYPPDPEWKKGKAHLIAYLGEIGTQDGVDGLVGTARIMRDDLGRRDFHCVVIGGGPHQPAVKALAAETGVAELFTFTGVVSDDELCRILSTADIGVDPVPKNDWSDKSSMNKVVEYMYFGLPVVTYDLTEARYTAEDAGAYAAGHTEADLANAIADVLDDPDRRSEMSTYGRRRIENELAWQHSVPHLLAAYDLVFET